MPKQLTTVLTCTSLGKHNINCVKHKSQYHSISYWQQVFFPSAIKGQPANLRLCYGEQVGFKGHRATGRSCIVHVNVSMPSTTPHQSAGYARFLPHVKAEPEHVQWFTPSLPCFTLSCPIQTSTHIHSTPCADSSAPVGVCGSTGMQEAAVASLVDQLFLFEADLW